MRRKHVWEGCRMWETEENWDEMMGVVLGENVRGKSG